MFLCANNFQLVSSYSEFEDPAKTPIQIDIISLVTQLCVWNLHPPTTRIPAVNVTYSFLIYILVSYKWLKKYDALLTKKKNSPAFYIPEQVVLDSSSSLPQSLSPSHSHRRGMQRLFWHLNRSAGQVCWSGGGNKKSIHRHVLVSYIQLVTFNGA